eukprot:GILK01001624.1.p1 GENE.GILK01001624.1~~GILK01001624.1.p1  ORF type:complete len:672 (-),score=62.11 GILK01001624.1:125-2140(-)
MATDSPYLALNTADGPWESEKDSVLSSHIDTNVPLVPLFEDEEDDEAQKLPSWKHVLYTRVPLFVWLPQYRKSLLRSDIIAGLTVGVMLVPQAMAYASLARLSLVTGLYAAFLPPIMYFIFGTSRQLSVGPGAILSLLTYHTLSTRGIEPDDPRYAPMAVLLMFEVGVIQTLMGLVRFGFVVNFLSNPVINGFTSAAALIIASSQIQSITNIPTDLGQDFFPILLRACQNVPHIHLLSLALATAAVALLLMLQMWKESNWSGNRIAKFLPGALIVVVGGTLFVYSLHQASGTVHGLNIVRNVVGGIQVDSPWSSMTFSDMKGLLPAAAVMVLVGFMEAISAAKFMAEKHRYEISPNQELFAIGLANFFGSFFCGYPIGGGFSRTAVTDQAGGKTPVASLISGIVVLISIECLTSLFYYLPKAVLGSIVIVAVFRLIDLRAIWNLWAINRNECVTSSVTFVCTLVFGIELGLALGVGISLLVVLQRTSRPHTAILGMVGQPPQCTFNNTQYYPEAKQFPRILLFRFDSKLFFANVAFLKQKLRKLRKTIRPTLRFIVIDCSAMNGIDSSGAEMVKKMIDEMADKKTTVLMAAANEHILKIIRRCHLQDGLMDNIRFRTVYEALTYAQSQLSTMDLGDTLGSPVAANLYSFRSEISDQMSFYPGGSMVSNSSV